MDKNRYTGNPDLKRFKRGSLAFNTPVSERDAKIFLLFVNGLTLKRIQAALSTDHIVLEEPALFDILRKVGFAYQTFYRGNVSSPFQIDQLIFADFVKGQAIRQLCETNALDPQSLINRLRKIGLVYALYYRQAR